MTTVSDDRALELAIGGMTCVSCAALPAPPAQRAGITVYRRLSGSVITHENCPVRPLVPSRRDE